MSWEVEGTDRFADWYGDLSDDEQLGVGRVVELLVEHGPALPFPHTSGIATSRHRHMRELRIQHAGRPYACCTHLIPGGQPSCCFGGDKTGQDRWYDVHVPIADVLYDRYLEALKKEGLL